jgi:type I restriction enzyme M protein
VRSGYILRDVVEQVSGINFNLSEDVHLVSVFYESMLREMRDAAGSSGEFYTPRPVVRLIIDRLAPKLGERILDPACGTCGFLAEAYERLKGEARTPAALQPGEPAGDREGNNAVLARVMNLLLHGVSRPSVDEPRAASPCESSGHRRVDMIATFHPSGRGGRKHSAELPEECDAGTAILFFSM